MHSNQTSEAGDDKIANGSEICRLDVEYGIEQRCVMIVGQSQAAQDDAAETVIELGSTDVEIDISPETDPWAGLVERYQDLASENEELKERIKELEKQTAATAAVKTTSLPTLYQQFIAMKAQVTEAEKRCQELEAENQELTTRLDRKNTEHDSVDKSNDPVDPSLLGRSQTMRCPPSISAIPESISRPLTGPVQTTGRMEDAESTKLDMAEKIVEQEETIQRVRGEYFGCLKKLTELSVGLDGLESRFESQLGTYASEVHERLDSLRLQLSALQQIEDDTTQAATLLKVDLQTVLKSVPEELQQLTRRYHDMKAEHQREKEELQELLENRELNLEEAKKQISAISDENDEYKTQNGKLHELVRSLKGKITSMKTMRLIPDSGGHHAVSNSREFNEMRARIEQLERNLAEQQAMYENLLREKDEAEETMFSITAVREDRPTEELKKENKELRNELMEVSEKLVDMEEENDALKADVENQSDFFGQCLNLEEELEAQRRVNRGLEEHLTRRKRRIDSLQCELGKLRQHIGDLESGAIYRKRSQENKVAVSNRMEEMLRAERHYEELDKILSAVQTERDDLLQSKAHLNKMMHSLIKENKLATRALNKLRREGPVLEQQLEVANAENKLLQARLKVETLARQHSGKSHASSSDVNEDIVSKLVTSQVTLAETDERMIRIRKELHRSVARNAFLASKVTRLEKQLRPRRA